MDIGSAPTHVCFTPKSGHVQCTSACLLWANSGHVQRVAGVDQSIEMVELARARNITAIQKDGVDLQWGSVESLPFGDSTFDKALAINSMHVWPGSSDFYGS